MNSLLAHPGLAWWPAGFAWPWLLWLCLLPLLLLLLPARKAQGAALRMPRALALPASQGMWLRHAGLAHALFVLAWCLLCVALARPQALGPQQQPVVQARQLMLALDLSGSMTEADMRLGGRPAERIVVARAVLDDFLSRRAGDQIGLVVFGQQAYVMSPVTRDLDSVRAQLADAMVGLAGQETAIGDAVALAVKRLRNQQHGQRVLILLTDGVNTAGAIDPRKAAELAAHDRVRVYTIAFGGEAGRGLFGLRAAAGNNQDEEVLRQLAQTTGGQFFRARNSDELAGIYAQIEALEPVDVSAMPQRLRIERYPPWLGAGLLLLVLAVLARRRT